MRKRMTSAPAYAVLDLCLGIGRVRCHSIFGFSKAADQYRGIDMGLYGGSEYKMVGHTPNIWKNLYKHGCYVKQYPKGALPLVLAVNRPRPYKMLSNVS